MPELPEVETIKNILKTVIVNKTIAKVDVFYEKVVKDEVNFFIKTLENKKFLNLARIGKYLIFHLSDEFVLISHLRMEGKFFYFENEQETKSKHGLVLFTFSDNTFLEYNDTRRFGMLKLSKEDEYLLLPFLTKLGPEPSHVKDVLPLYQKSRKRGIAIKSLLLDQTFLSGLGNIYVDEVLFKTKVHPETPAHLITQEKLKEIINVSVEVLNEAILSGGSTIRSYKAGLGIDGNFQTKLLAYGRKDQPCITCQTPLKKIFVNNRGTTYCVHCQRNLSWPYIIGITGPIASGKSSVLDYFKKKGYFVLSGDEIVHRLYQDQSIFKKLIRLFSKEVILENGLVNKKLITKVIIHDSHLKYQLEKLLHPLVEKEMLDFIKRFDQTQKVAIEMPLLFEAQLDAYCDETIYVDVKRDIQEARLANRSLSVEHSLLLNASFNQEANKKKATYIIKNNKSLSELVQKLDKLFINN